jgi:hypothetical protein
MSHESTGRMVRTAPLEQMSSRSRRATDGSDTGPRTVFITSRESTCADCGSALGRSAWIHLAKDQGALCLACADLDHLVFLPSGDPAVTRRAKAASTLWAVVLRWSRARRRYERQGLLVEEAAIESSEASCLADAEARAARARRQAERAAGLDQAYVTQFAAAVQQRYPGCPPSRAVAIAEHACRKYSGRIGRTAAAKSLEAEAIDLAVRAHVRHTDTPYDRLLAMGTDRQDARQSVSAAVTAVLARWEM